MMGLINLGNVTLEYFEVPSCVKFGGKQQLVVHKLIGGARVVDALGRDDSALNWQGILSGTEAADRSRALDAMRVAGISQLLTWDAFCYTVIVSELRFSFRNPWWIPYEITCIVQQDLAQGSVIFNPTLAGSVVDDLTEVGQLLGSSITVDATSISNLLSSGSSGQQQALSATSAINATVTQKLANAESSLGSSDLGMLTSSAGSLAQLCCAQGYLERCMINIVNADN